MEAQLCQPAAAPDPMAADRVDDGRNQHGVNAVGRKLGALGHGAGHDGRSGRAEDGLENERCPAAVAAGREQVNAADQCARAAEHQAKAENPENRRAQRKVHQVFHNDVARILCTGKAGLYHGKTGLHKEDQRCTQQNPADIQGIAQCGDVVHGWFPPNDVCLFFCETKKRMVHTVRVRSVRTLLARCTPLCRGKKIKRNGYEREKR